MTAGVSRLRNAIVDATDPHGPGPDGGELDRHEPAQPVRVVAVQIDPLGRSQVLADVAHDGKHVATPLGMECLLTVFDHGGRAIVRPAQVGIVNADVVGRLVDIESIDGADEMPAKPEYPYHDRTARVTRCGRICIGKRKINLSQVFAGQIVGIREVDNQIWLVSFLDYDLGFFDKNEGRVEPAPNPFAPEKVLTMSPE